MRFTVFWSRRWRGVSQKRQRQFVSTEKQIHTTHGGLHEADEAIKELECILRRHILEANDVPSVDGYEIAVPQYVIPTVVMPECEDVCPDELCPDELCPDFICPPITCPPLTDPCLTGAEHGPLLQALPSRDSQASAADRQQSVLRPPGVSPDPTPGLGPNSFPAEFESTADQPRPGGWVTPEPEIPGPEFFFPEL